MKRRVRFEVAGRVQGVGFRYSAREQAERLGLTGWVRNRASGDVHGEAEGADAAVDAFLAWCKHGPAGARVDRVTVEDEQLGGDLPRFEIRH